MTVALLLLLTLPAQAHTRVQLDGWLDEWETKADYGLTPLLLDQLEDMSERHRWYFDEDASSGATVSSAPSGAVHRGMGSDVQRWRDLVGVYFAPGDVETVLCLMGYESGGNPNAYNPSGASGLMQVLKSWAPKFGVSASDLFDPDVNLRISAELRKIGWTQWSPYNRGLCHGL